MTLEDMFGRNKGSKMAATSNNSNDDVETTPMETEVTNAELKELILSMDKRLNNRMDALETQLNDVLSRVDSGEKEIDELKKSLENNASRIQILESVTVPDIHARNMETKNTALKHQLLAEIHDRNQNLLFYGVKQVKGEDVYHVVRDFLITDFDFTQEEASMVFIVNAHRLPTRNLRGEDEDKEKRPDPIIVRFGCMRDRDYVLECMRNRGFIRDRRPIMCYTDLPATMKRLRGELVTLAKVLKTRGKETRIRVVGIKLILDCRAKNAKNSPWKLHTEVIASL
jgi:hypothetical protein